MEIEINVFIQVNIGHTPVDTLEEQMKKRTNERIVRADSLFLCFFVG